MIEAHPAFWAGHVLYGNKKPFKLPKPIVPILVLTLLIILLMLISIVLIVKYTKYRKNKSLQIDLPAKLRTKDRI